MSKPKSASNLEATWGLTYFKNLLKNPLKVYVQDEKIDYSCYALCIRFWTPVHITIESNHQTSSHFLRSGLL
jgi:ABC-type polysaccharide transport system permease subunit